MTSSRLALLAERIGETVDEFLADQYPEENYECLPRNEGWDLCNGKTVIMHLSRADGWTPKLVDQLEQILIRITT